jgi:hypothetical protein
MNKNQRSSGLKTKKGCGVHIDYLEQTAIPLSKLNAGITSKLIEVLLSDGRTRIFCKPTDDINAKKAFWETHIKFKP